MNKIKNMILGVLALFSFMGEGLWASKRDDDKEWKELTKPQRWKKMQNLYNESYQKLGIANEDEIIDTLIKKL